jgi:hypothetical protein
VLTLTLIFAASKQVISAFIRSLEYSNLPSHFLLPASSFRFELEELLLRHLTVPPSAQALAHLERESALWSDQNLIFFDSRASFNRFGLWVYDKLSKQLSLLQEDQAEGSATNGMTSLRILPIYRILSLGYRKELQENPVALQSRSTTLTIWYQNKEGKDRYHPTEITDLNEWLGTEIIQLAKSHSTKGSWIPYVRNLIGLSDTIMAGTTGSATRIELPLSSLIVLFLKCSNASTKTFPTVDSNGCWVLPAIEGNQGKDEHLFFNATDEVRVRVI